MTAIFSKDFWGLCDSDINISYPPNNDEIFEKFLLNNYHKYKCETDRCYLPIQWTAYYVNHNYGNDKDSLNKLQNYINKFSKDVKYWTCVQYDDGILNDVSNIDLLQFNMSKNKGIEIPLLCQPHPYKFSGDKKYLVSFVGSRTHSVRNGIEKYVNKENWYISYEHHSIEQYCKILSESVFVLCPRGYGLNSFRLSEALQYGAIPIYISDEFVLPFDNDNPNWMVLVKNEDVGSLARIINDFSEIDIVNMQEFGKKAYEEYYTYEGCLKKIIDELEAEYNNRKETGKVRTVNEGIE